MFAVVAVYPSGHLVLVGFECIAHNGKEKLMEMGVRFNVELAG